MPAALAISEFAASRTVEGVEEGTTVWEGKHELRYVRCLAKEQSAKRAAAVLFLHGFGGNADHFKNQFAFMRNDANVDCYALDVLGYGYSDKPDPSEGPLRPTAHGKTAGGPSLTPDGRKLYSFENWADQALHLIDEVVPPEQEVVLVCNSVGGITGMQAAVAEASRRSDAAQRRIKGIMLIDLSLRMLHVTKTAPAARPLVAALQNALYSSPLGDGFFANVATKETVESVLRQAYGAPSGPISLASAVLNGETGMDWRVDDDLVSRILTPGLRPNAARVFLDFISYSAGPTPEELLAAVDVPVSFVWGARDPWEKVEWGRALAERFDAARGEGTVVAFDEVPDGGHCVMDQRPEAVNPRIADFLRTLELA